MIETKYGAINENPVADGYHQQEREFISWGELVERSGGKGLTVERIRFVTDPGFPALDLSYLHIIWKGKKYFVTGSPFSQIPKKGWKRHLIEELKKEGVFLAKLFDRASVLWG